MCFISSTAVSYGWFWCYFTLVLKKMIKSIKNLKIYMVFKHYDLSNLRNLMILNSTLIKRLVIGTLLLLYFLGFESVAFASELEDPDDDYSEEFGGIEIPYEPVKEYKFYKDWRVWAVTGVAVTAGLGVIYYLFFSNSGNPPSLPPSDPTVPELPKDVGVTPTTDSVVTATPQVDLADATTDAAKVFTKVVESVPFDSVTLPVDAATTVTTVAVVAKVLTSSEVLTFLDGFKEKVDSQTFTSRSGHLTIKYIFENLETARNVFTSTYPGFGILDHYKLRQRLLWIVDSINAGLFKNYPTATAYFVNLLPTLPVEEVIDAKNKCCELILQYLNMLFTKVKSVIDHPETAKSVNGNDFSKVVPLAFLAFLRLFQDVQDSIFWWIRTTELYPFIEELQKLSGEVFSLSNLGSFNPNNFGKFFWEFLQEWVTTPYNHTWLKKKEKIFKDFCDKVKDDTLVFSPHKSRYKAFKKRMVTIFEILRKLI